MRRLGKLKDSEFTFQTSWDDDGEQASTVAHEPRENPSGCWHRAGADRSGGGVRNGVFHYTGCRANWRSRLPCGDGRTIRLYQSGIKKSTVRWFKKRPRGKTRCSGYGIGCRKHRQGAVVWCDSFPFLALESAFTRNAPRPETRREIGSVAVSGFRLGTKVDP